MIGEGGGGREKSVEVDAYYSELSRRWGKRYSKYQVLYYGAACTSSPLSPREGQS